MNFGVNMIAIKWLDSVDISISENKPWLSKEELDSMDFDKIEPCLTVGNLIKETDYYYVIGNSYAKSAGNPNKDEHSGVMAIPKCSVIEKSEFTNLVSI